MKKVITFDVHDTLLKNNPAWKAARYQLVREFSSIPDITNDQIDAGFRKVKDANDHVLAIYGTMPDNLHLFAQVAYELEITAMREFRNQYFNGWLEHPSLVYDQDTAAVLSGLKEQDYSLVVICNTLLVPGDVIAATLKARGLLSYFHTLRFSDDWGMSKPYPEFFYKGAEYHVGDNPDTDGASVEVGVPFFQINSNKKTISDFYAEITHSDIFSA